MYIDNVWGILDQIQGPGGKEGSRALGEKKDSGPFLKRSNMIWILNTMLNIDPRMDFQHWALFLPEYNEESRVLYQVVQ